MGNPWDYFAGKAGPAAAGMLLCLAGIGAAHAAMTTYDFDTFGDGVAPADQYGGLYFVNASVALASISLNESAFPPHSVTGVVYDGGGVIVIKFDRLASGVSGYFTYLQSLTLAAYDSADNLLAFATSAYGTNLDDGTGDPGSVPKELLAVTTAGDLIARIVIGGASLVLDDLPVTTAAAAVFAPGMLPLVAFGVGGLALVLCGHRRMR